MEILTSPVTTYEKIRDERLARMCPVCANPNTKLKEHQVEQIGFLGSKFRERDVHWCWYCNTVWADDWSKPYKKSKVDIALLNMDMAAKHKLND